jgi:hypothetical protein
MGKDGWAGPMTVRRGQRPWHACQFGEFEKDGEIYLLPCDGVLGEQPYPVQVMERLIYELQRSLAHITDKDIAEYNATFMQNYEKEYCQTRDIQQRSQEGRKGFVYIIRGGDSYYKIGCTTNPSKRLIPMKAHAPFPLETLLLIPSEDMTHTEATLHAMFAKKHRRGEWYDLTEYDISQIRREYATIDPAALRAN